MRLAVVMGSLVHGGAERQSIALANRLAERGHEVHAFYVKGDASQLPRLRLPARSVVRWIGAKRYLDLPAIRDLRASLGDVQPDVVLAANHYALLYASLAAAGAPIVVSFHSTRAASAKEAVQLLAYRPLFWSAACTIFVCERQREHWRRRALLSRRSAVIYNGVDIEAWRPDAAAGTALRQALGYRSEDYVIGLCAVLRPEKNPVQLVEAIALLRRAGVRAKALFIGDGPEREAVRQRARALDVDGSIAISGLQQDVRPFVGACDAMTLTSRVEAFSMSALEAMALERPVVHADIGGAREMIRDRYDGFVFPVGDTAALTRCLAQLADPARRDVLGKRARRAVESRFSERAMVDQYEHALAHAADQTLPAKKDAVGQV